ncbi:MAG: trypsin-like serine peptidase [Desulfurivibrionaceae bacterium]
MTNLKYLMNLSKVLARHIIPIFQRDNQDKPCLMGSGTLVVNEGHVFILTAAHVMDPLREGKELFYYVDDKWTQTISGDCVFTLPPTDTTRKDDRIDIGVIRLEGPKLPPYPTISQYPIAISALRPHALPRDDKEYLLVGFPASKAKAKQRGPDKVIGLKPFSYRNGSPPHKKYHELGFNPKIHILIGFDQKHVICEENGRRQCAPSPKGMSGSPLWLIYCANEHIDPLCPPIVGIVVEHHRKDRIMLATDIAVAIDAMKNGSSGKSVGTCHASPASMAPSE